MNSPRAPPATFFVFDDLSIRSVGYYRLKFTLLRMDEFLIAQGSHIPAIAETLSKTFEVFAPKAFPGMMKTSALAEGLKREGLKLRPKQGAEVRKRQDNSIAEEEETRACQGNIWLK